MLDTILSFLYTLASLAVGWLPNSPFQTSEFRDAVRPVGEVMSWVNYFVPVGQMLAVFAVYLVAVGIWYAVRWLLRLAQYID
jgi:hypothetical protein